MEQIDITQLTKLYYSIGELSEMFNVNTSLIRFWEKEFNIIQPKKTKKGNRMFTVKDIEKFNKIYHLVKINGYTLDGAKKALKSKINLELSEDQLSNSPTSKNEDIIIKLESIKEKLNKLKKNFN